MDDEMDERELLKDRSQNHNIDFEELFSDIEVEGRSLKETFLKTHDGNGNDQYSLLTDQENLKQETINSSPGNVRGNGVANNAVVQANGLDPLHDTKSLKKKDATVLDPWDPYSIVKLSISGKVYVTLRKTLTFFPDTLLGSKEIDDFWNEDLGMYYFNRHRGVFNSILFFYQSRGVFRAPTNVEPDIMKEEMEFFKVDVQKILDFKDEEEEIVEIKLTLRQKLHTFLTDPQYSRPALYWSFVDMFAIVLSIILLVAESVPSATEAFENPKYKVYYFLYSLEVLVNGFFTVDFILKFISWPKPWLFFKNPLNCLDFMAILPFYMELITMISQKGGSGGGKFVVLRICRTSRVVRIFRFARHSKELLVVMKVVSGATKEFAMLAMLIMVFVLLFGTFLYYSEMGYDSNFDSILHGCWWAIVTVTTVGYGDLAPKSTIGRLIGSIAVVLGIVILALPMTVIVSKFNESYGDVKRNTEREQLEKIRAHAIANGAIF